MDKEEERLKLDIMRTYIDGKLRRYNLLWAANGGAFAIVQMMVGKDAISVDFMVSGLLGVLMIAFTLIMCGDIFVFGNNMANSYNKKFPELGLFGPAGKRVLSSMGLLLVLGWIGTLAFFWSR
jgi:hypothetical protein